MLNCDKLIHVEMNWADLNFEGIEILNEACVSNWKDNKVSIDNNNNNNNV